MQLGELIIDLYVFEKHCESIMFGRMESNRFWFPVAANEIAAQTLFGPQCSLSLRKSTSLNIKWELASRYPPSDGYIHICRSFNTFVEDLMQQFWRCRRSWLALGKMGVFQVFVVELSNKS
jgi:hypothetical protein